MGDLFFLTAIPQKNTAHKKREYLKVFSFFILLIKGYTAISLQNLP